MAFSLDDLVTPVTREQAQQSIYDALGVLGVNVTDWKAGAVTRTLIVVFALMLSALSELQALIARSGFLDLSEGDWLVLVAKFVYGVDKELATFATGPLTLTNAGGGVYSFAPGDLIAANTLTGKTYRNTTSGSLAAFGTVTLQMQATEVGSASNAGPGAVSTLVTALVGVSCSNSLGYVGLDDESDPSLRIRCSEKLGSLSPGGPWDAYAFAARNAKRADGSSIGVTRVRITKDGFGNVYVYVATAAGAVPGTVGDLSTDLGAVDEAIQQRAAPLAVTAHVISATNVVVPVTYTLWMYNTSGQTPAQVADLVASRLLLFFQGQPVGGNVIDPDPGKVFVDAIKATIVATLPEIFHAVVSAPASDIVLAVGDVAVLGTPTATAINQVPPSEGHP